MRAQVEARPGRRRVMDAMALLQSNRVLASLPAAASTKLAADCVPRAMRAGELLAGAGEVAPAIWFPLGGAVSLMTETEEGRCVQVALIGREGFVTPIASSGRPAPWHAIVRLAAPALAISAERFRAHLVADAALGSAAQDEAARLLPVVVESIACSHFHSVRQRMARVLLALDDRAEAPVVPVTQQSLADMIGVHRPTVSLAAHAMSDAGLIRYARGRVTILDRPRLQTTACPCYERAAIDA